ncbi:hypothetical protein G9C85_03920 [Halorubellus sp. JP-L1]|uniref:hypothetical protein n=1 Tax=Halorubellus sp. JP-L1 TaxID=2715753 RepID=UPI00140E56F6|nr:hypothetical protein [Halorubellus sp. JP-L1]NHN40783.1 hypothetical protein [Halorubellus sp. JP-L1]
MRESYRTMFVVAMTMCVAFAGSAVAANAVTEDAAENVHDGTVSPDAVEGSTTVDHTASFHVDDVSKDGGTDRFYVEFPNDANLSVNGATVTNRSDGSSVAISSSAEVVDGPDEDGVMDTVAFAVSPSGSGKSVDVNATVSVTVEWPAVDADRSMALHAAVEDSSLANVERTQFASVTVEAVDDTTEATTTEATATTAPTTTEATATTAPTTDGTMTTSANGDVTMTTSANGGVDAGDGSGGSPGFGLAVATLALALAAGIALRRT